MGAAERLRAKVADPESIQATRLDRTIADIHAKEPPMDAVILRYVTAWHDLCTCRAIGMAAGPIPFTAIVAWAEFHGLDREEAVLLKNIIRQLDNDQAERDAAKRDHDRIMGAQR